MFEKLKRRRKRRLGINKKKEKENSSSERSIMSMKGKEIGERKYKKLEQ
jgi:hypothetical protein